MSHRKLLLLSWHFCWSRNWRDVLSTSVLLGTDWLLKYEFTEWNNTSLLYIESILIMLQSTNAIFIFQNCLLSRRIHLSFLWHLSKILKSFISNIRLLNEKNSPLVKFVSYNETERRIQMYQYYTKKLCQSFISQR